MELDPVLIIVVMGSVGGLLIERFFYYRSKYKEKKTEKAVPVVAPVNLEKPENPSHGERLMGLETDVENLKENNEKDHKLIRQDIAKLNTRLNGVLKR